MSSLTFDWDLDERLYDNDRHLFPATSSIRARNRQAEQGSHPKARRQVTAFTALEELLAERLPLQPIRADELLDWDPDGEWMEFRQAEEMRILCEQQGITWPLRLAA